MPLVIVAADRYSPRAAGAPLWTAGARAVMGPENLAPQAFAGSPVGDVAGAGNGAR
ncbi:hypothetical protein GCM10023322_46650 [Rugosimonospora acidiphila]|uniref:Glycerate kinase n=1 Tax=Rugosimonospora acidiphila TaxID=556531 RepID=A0ABP9S309_9ACTN